MSKNLLVDDGFGNKICIFVQDRNGKIYSRHNTESDYGNHYTLCCHQKLNEDEVLKWTWVDYDTTKCDDSFGIKHLTCFDKEYLPFEPKKTHLDAIEKFFKLIETERMRNDQQPLKTTL